MPPPASGLPPPRVRDRLREAALLRANGAGWAAVGSACGVTAETASRWPRKYPAAWRQATRAAARQVLADATAEAVLTLRRHLRSEDEKSSREAAVKIVQFASRLTRPRPARRVARLTPAAAFLEGLTDAQLDQIIAELRPDHDAKTGNLDASTTHGPS